MKVMRLERYSFDPKKDCSKQDWYGVGRAGNDGGDQLKIKEPIGFSMDIGARAQPRNRPGGFTKSGGPLT